MKYIVPGKPVAQKRHRHTKKGFVYDPSSKEKKDFIAKLKSLPKKVFKGDISLQVYFYLPYPKKYYRTGKYKGILKDKVPHYCKTRPDIDNYIKFVMDCLNGLVYKDDSQVVDIYSNKLYATNPQTIIIIKEI